MPSGSSAKYLVTVSAHGTTKVCELDAREIHTLWADLMGVFSFRLVLGTPGAEVSSEQQEPPAG